MYIDLLTRLKNAQAVKRENIKVPYSKMDEAVLRVLEKNNYIESFEKRGRVPKKILDIKLRYDNNEGIIRGVKLWSKPSRSLYLGVKDIRPVRHGYGLLVISTPEGIVSGKEARRKNIGGEALFEIW